jgi:hypothetical protein
LLRRFGQATQATQAIQRLSFDLLLLKALREEATTAGIRDWSIVLNADAADPGSRDWNNLQRLVQRTLATLKPTLLSSSAPLLLVNVGLIARYNLMPLVTEIENSSGRPGQTPSLWLLLPSHHQGLPVIDGVPVPLVNATQAFTLPQAWIENKHRASVSA